MNHHERAIIQILLRRIDYCFQRHADPRIPIEHAIPSPLIKDLYRMMDEDPNYKPQASPPPRMNKRDVFDRMGVEFVETRYNPEKDQVEIISGRRRGREVLQERVPNRVLESQMARQAAEQLQAIGQQMFGGNVAPNKGPAPPYASKLDASDIASITAGALSNASRISIEKK